MTMTRRIALALGATPLVRPAAAFAQTLTAITIGGVPEDSITAALCHRADAN